MQPIVLSVRRYTRCCQSCYLFVGTPCAAMVKISPGSGYHQGSRACAGSFQGAGCSPWDTAGACRPPAGCLSKNANQAGEHAAGAFVHTRESTHSRSHLVYTRRNSRSHHSPFRRYSIHMCILTCGALCTHACMHMMHTRMLTLAPLPPPVVFALVRGRCGCVVCQSARQHQRPKILSNNCRTRCVLQAKHRTTQVNSRMGQRSKCKRTRAYRKTGAMQEQKDYRPGACQTTSVTGKGRERTKQGNDMRLST